MEVLKGGVSENLCVHPYCVRVTPGMEAFRRPGGMMVFDASAAMFARGRLTKNHLAFETFRFS